MTDLPEDLPIEISAYTLCCSSHGEHFRAKWPSGFGVVGLEFAYELLNNPSNAFFKVATKRGKLDVDRVNKVLSYRPMCYWLTREKMLETWLLTEGLFTKGRCDICGHIRLSGNYSITYMTGIHTENVCIECALDAGEREHLAFPKGRDQRKARGL